MSMSVPRRAKNDDDPSRVMAWGQSISFIFLGIMLSGKWNGEFQYKWQKRGKTPGDEEIRIIEAKERNHFNSIT